MHNIVRVRPPQPPVASRVSPTYDALASPSTRQQYSLSAHHHAHNLLRKSFDRIPPGLRILVTIILIGHWVLCHCCEFIVSHCNLRRQRLQGNPWGGFCITNSKLIWKVGCDIDSFHFFWEPDLHKVAETLLPRQQSKHELLFKPVEDKCAVNPDSRTRVFCGQPCPRTDAGSRRA